MKRRNVLAIAILLLSLAALALNLSLAKEEHAGMKMDVPVSASASVKTSNETTKIGDLIKNASALQGQSVALQGKITTECPMGCWFILDDGSGNVTVDLKPNNFVIPQKKNSTALVYGKVSSKNDSTIVLGQKVEIDGVIYKAQLPNQLKNASVKIGDILQNKSRYLGTAAVVGGKITTECGMGCWFILNDGTGDISVDLAPHNFTIPQRKGAQAKTYGKVIEKNDTIYVYGEFVEIGDELFKGA
ncbi:MAG: hypothetical protein ACE14P_14460 [Methanotrichaceae archaeon]